MKLNSLSKFNAALRKAGIAAELVKGEGYFYYAGIEYPSFCTCAYSHCLEEIWAEEFNSVVAFCKALEEKATD